MNKIILWLNRPPPSTPCHHRTPVADRRWPRLCHLWRVAVRRADVDMAPNADADSEWSDGGVHRLLGAISGGPVAEGDAEGDEREGCMTDLKVGDTVWVWDANRRVYRRDEQGRAVGGPIYREHFRPVKIIGETSRSWLVGRGSWDQIKVNKKTLQGIYTSQEQIDREVWLEVHRYKLGEAVQRCSDYDTLRQIAALVGYEE